MGVRLPILYPYPSLFDGFYNQTITRSSAITDRPRCFVSLNISLKVVQTGTFRKLWYTVSYVPSIVTMALSCIVCEIKRDIGRKSRFFLPPAFDVAVRGSLSEYCHTVWSGKTGMVGLPDGENVWMFSRFDRYGRVMDTDRLMNGWMDGHLATA